MSWVCCLSRVPTALVRECWVGLPHLYLIIGKERARAPGGGWCLVTFPTDSAVGRVRPSRSANEGL